jgi:hypothetical protein
MRQQIRVMLFGVAATSAIAACASSAPALSTGTASATVDIPGYVRVVSGDQELLCRQEIPIASHIAQTVCFTRDQLKEQERAIEWLASTPAPNPVNLTSMYYFSPSGR